MTIGALVQRVLRREPLSEEPQNPRRMPPVESGIPAGEQQDERSRQPEQLLRYESD